MSELDGPTPSGQLAPGEPTVEGAPQQVQEPQGQEPLGGEPSFPEKFQGKSAEEIAQAYVELERKLGEQAQELGDLRQRVPTMPYPAPPQGYQPQGYYPPPPGYPVGAPVQQAPREPLKMNWENPVDTIAQVVRQEVLPLITGYQQNAARGMQDIAFENAKAKDPALFDGVEPNVKAFMDNMINQGVLRPDSALSPETWRMAAWQMQGMKSGYKPRPAGPPLQPIPSVRTETPGSRPPYVGPSGPPLGEADRRMSAKMGISEEQARKNMAGRK
jgi:hypothetical protein